MVAALSNEQVIMLDNGIGITLSGKKPEKQEKENLAFVYLFLLNSF